MTENGFFGKLFDFDGNGRLDDLERAADFATFIGLVNQANEDSDSEDDDDE